MCASSFSDAYGHASERQTLDYLCVQAQEIEELYDLELYRPLALRMALVVSRKSASASSIACFRVAARSAS